MGSKNAAPLGGAAARGGAMERSSRERRGMRALGGGTQGSREDTVSWSCMGWRSAFMPAGRRRDVAAREQVARAQEEAAGVRSDGTMGERRAAAFSREEGAVGDGSGLGPSRQGEEREGLVGYALPLSAAQSLSSPLRYDAPGGWSYHRPSMTLARDFSCLMLPSGPEFRAAVASWISARRTCPVAVILSLCCCALYFLFRPSSGLFGCLCAYSVASCSRSAYIFFSHAASIASLHTPLPYIAAALAMASAYMACSALHRRLSHGFHVNVNFDSSVNLSDWFTDADFESSLGVPVGWVFCGS